MPDIKPIRVAPSDFSINPSYIAGFVDGEGSISFSRNNSKVKVRMDSGSVQTSNVSYFPIITIVNTNRDVLDCIKSFSNCGKIYKRKDSRAKNHSTTYALSFASRNSILSFLSLIKEYLIVKKVQAEAMFSFLKSRESKVPFLGQNSPYSETELELIEICKNANKEASHRAKGFRKEDLIGGINEQE